MTIIPESRRPCFPKCNTSPIMLGPNERKSREVAFVRTQKDT
jgi:hypothetical protein